METSLLEIARNSAGRKSIVLDETLYDKHIRVEEGTAIIVKADNVTVKADVPLWTNCSSVVIKGDKNSKLILESTESIQPCIGGMTNTGISYGRWESTIDKLIRKIVIDGVTVECKSKTENFSIGNYNTADVPVIECINGGKLICPETTGYRKLVLKAYPPAGSTKISMCAEYVITQSENDNPLCKSVQSLVYKMNSLGIDSSRVTSDIIPTDLKSVIEFAKLGLDVNCVFDNYDKVKMNVATYLGAVCVGVDANNPKLLASVRQMNTLGILAENDIDVLKQEAVLKKYGISTDVIEFYEMDIKKLYNEKVNSVDELNDKGVMFWWQLIPVFDYTRCNNRREEVRNYFKK